MNNIVKDKQVDSLYIIDSWKTWPIVTIFSWIHWDEVSWIRACEKFLKAVSNNVIEINIWKIQLVIWCNKEAIKIWKREVKYNMNRLFNDDLDVDFSDYEHKRSRELMQVIKKWEYLLDLHSTPWPSIPFMYCEKINMDLWKKLWVSHVIVWWNALGDIVSWDTENYMNFNSWKWFTFEAWDHESLDWEKNAFQCILNFLSSLWIIDDIYFKNIWEENSMFMEMKWVYTAKSNSFKYNINLDNFQKIKAWTIIWYDNWEENIVNEDIIFIMPKVEDIIKKWIEVYFIWKEISY